MKANDLRVGNLVLVNGTETEAKPDLLEYMFFKDKGHEFSTLEISIEPIELNEEWLKRMGFEYYQTDKSHVYRLGSFLVTYVFDGKFKGKKYLKFCDTTYPEFGHIQYVHTFQNFFYASVGHELEIK